MYMNETNYLLKTHNLSQSILYSVSVRTPCVCMNTVNGYFSTPALYSDIFIYDIQCLTGPTFANVWHKIKGYAPIQK